MGVLFPNRNVRFLQNKKRAPKRSFKMQIETQSRTNSTVPLLKDLTRAKDSTR